MAMGGRWLEEEEAGYELLVMPEEEVVGREEEREGPRSRPREVEEVDNARLPTRVGPALRHLISEQECSQGRTRCCSTAAPSRISQLRKR